LQAEGIIDAPPIEMDAKDFGVGAQILHDLNINKINLLTNAERVKRVGIIGYGLEITNTTNY
jgi:3,4-dihydroxy 2-butanone 4-phosphate synthase/GTP cyclohydrolase II